VIAKGALGQARSTACKLVVAAALLVGCGPVASDEEEGAPHPGGGPDGGTPALADDGTGFIAFQRDFQAFASWTHFELEATAPVGTGPGLAAVHLAGKRVVYVNQMPAHGQTEFAKGTIIVKTMETGETFARVKRGGGYNKSGARGWEWFELKPVGADWVILWRGITPPTGVCSYGGTMGGACNDCHAGFTNNDFVATSALDLTAF
jgi:hypothetical protein